MSEPFLGEIRIFGGNFVPRGWAPCNGSLLSIAQNSALFSLLGTTYGGDGRQTFALPDLNGRAPVGTGQGAGLAPVAHGQKFGSETTTLTVANLPPHNHPIPTHLPAATPPASPQPLGVIGYDPANPPAAGVAATGAVGDATPISIQSPALGLQFIIAVEGIYPSRQ